MAQVAKSGDDGDEDIPVASTAGCILTRRYCVFSTRYNFASSEGRLKIDILVRVGGGVGGGRVGGGGAALLAVPGGRIHGEGRRTLGLAEPKQRRRRHTHPVAHRASLGLWRCFAAPPPPALASPPPAPAHQPPSRVFTF